MVAGWRMWAMFLLTITPLLSLLSAAPLDIAAGGTKADAKADNDGMHSHDGNVTVHYQRGEKMFSHNQFDIRNINVSGSVAGDDISIGHKIKIDVHEHTHDHHHHEADLVVECKEQLRQLFKSIDSDKDGLIDAKELLTFCQQNNIHIAEHLAEIILTLPDKTVGLNLAKFCELLKDCQSTNSADLIHFLLQAVPSLQLSDKVIDGGWSEWSAFRPCSATCGDATKRRTRTCTQPEPANGGKDCVESNEESVSCGLQKCVDRFMFEGDMILDKGQLKFFQAGLLDGELDGVSANENTLNDNGMAANAIKDPNRLWPNKVVYYSFHENVKLSAKNKVRTVLSGLQEKLSSCLTFQERDEGNRVVVASQVSGCNSEVGYMNSIQQLNLDSGCLITGIIEHEFLHAIGIFHTQSRSDRDDYIKINRENIMEGAGDNFRSYTESTVSHFGLPYDYSSVMHYGKKDFGIYGRTTIETLGQHTIGQRDGVSVGDIELIKRAYQCPSAGSCEVHVGSSVSNIKSATVSEGCACPAEINRNNWIGGHHYPDKYVVTQNGGSLQVQREDSNGGWGMYLAFMCELKGNSCTDKDTACQGWKRDKFCETEPESMKNLCAKTCGLC